MYYELKIKPIIISSIFLVIVSSYVIICFQGVPVGPLAWISLLFSSVGLGGCLAVIMLGSASRYSPWRCIWRIFPKLNEIFIPDLNGVWKGKGSSNWSRVGLLREYAESNQAIGDNSIDDTDLNPFNIEVKIVQTLLYIKMYSELFSTNSKSNAVCIRLEKFVSDNSFRLIYVYEQRTPVPRSTDEGTHHGAATLEWRYSDSLNMSGHYWTDRSWSQGLNTSGTLYLTKE